MEGDTCMVGNSHMFVGVRLNELVMTKNVHVFQSSLTRIPIKF